MRALTIKQLTKNFSNGVQALKGVDLTVEEGEFFALLGPNGAGKTTLIGIVSSLVNKTSGQVNIFDYNLDIDPIAAKVCMGLVPQELNFNQFEKVFDIVVNQAGFYGISRNIAKANAEKYLNKLGLWNKRNEMARALSGGMKRRLMIARALVHEPRMLILDEPTAGVDIELRRTTWEFLSDINRAGTTIILTTHYLEEAELLCNGVAIIDKGQILERTLMRDLLAKLPYETLVLDLQKPINQAQLPNVEHIQMNLVDPITLEVRFHSTNTINDVFEQLSQREIHVRSMRNKSNRLEELFLNRITQQNNFGAK
jgi:ABC-2 type transport system ATP-binding protein